MKTKADQENTKWENGMVSGAVYSGEKSITQVADMVYSFYSLSNPLHADIWPTISQCEAEIISMTAGTYIHRYTHRTCRSRYIILF